MDKKFDQCKCKAHSHNCFFFNRQRYDIVNKKMCTLKVVRKKTQSMAKTASAHEMVPIC